MATARDPCVVATGPLAEMLNSFIAAWSRSRPALSARYSDAPPTAMSAMEYLLAKTGLPESTLRSVSRNRRSLTELRIADPIVAVIGQQYAFHNGTLEVVPNPRVKASSHDCCGGSLTAGLR